MTAARRSDPSGRARWIPWAVLAAILVPAGAVALVVRGGGDASEPPSPDRDPTVLPLVGTPGDVPDRAPLAVKIGNSPAGRPPVGLAEADIVQEELVEGGLTRLVAVYQSEDPETVGPVRSARPTDLAVLAELGRPLFAWSGANAEFRPQVEAADILDVGAEAEPGAYRRDPQRSAPYDLMASPEDLRAAAEAVDATAATEPPSPVFTYRAGSGTLADVPGAEPAGGYLADGSATSLTTSIRWDWDGAAWVRSQDGTPHVDATGDELTAVNVVIRSTPYRDSGQRDARGAVVPEAEAVGEGDAWLLRDGYAVPGRWSKPAAGAPTTYTTDQGEPLDLAPGSTWVEILPPGSGTILDQA